MDFNKPIITSCMRGINACNGYVLAVYAGLQDVRLYSGSYSEWKALKGE
jgi:3-mercaptopyruvate sulfurtransferase SseA